MDINNYPEISVELFYSKPATTPRSIFETKAKVVHEESTRQSKKTEKLAKSSSVRKAREHKQGISGNERKRKALVDAPKVLIKKAKLEVEDAAPIDENNNSLQDPAATRMSKRKRSPFKIFVSKNLDDNNNISYDDLEKSIKDYDENAPKHAKIEKEKKSDLPAQYLGSNVSFDDDPETMSIEEFVARLHKDDRSRSRERKRRVNKSMSLTTLINTLEGTNL